MRIRYTTPASRDLAEILDQTTRDWPGSLIKLKARLKQAETLIATFPEAAPLTDYPGIRRQNMRPFPFLIFYRINVLEAEILRVLHAAREPFDPSAG